MLGYPTFLLVIMLYQTRFSVFTWNKKRKRYFFKCTTIASDLFFLFFFLCFFFSVFVFLRSSFCWFSVFLFFDFFRLFCYCVIPLSAYTLLLFWQTCLSIWLKTVRVLFLLFLCLIFCYNRFFVYPPSFSFLFLCFSSFSSILFYFLTFLLPSLSSALCIAVFGRFFWLLFSAVFHIFC